MKQQQLIFSNLQSPGTCIFASRDEWTLEIVKTPRKSCIEALKIRNDLRKLMPGERRYIGGVWVTKINSAHKPTRYLIDGKQYAFEQTIAILENVEEQKAS